ncbi:MAG: signal peptidase I [Thermoanaerobaculaceae bacterium]|jgi:signal peptidase I|nr:signal peptidase I [Thermoanaerobaculaceae bacterium]
MAWTQRVAWFWREWLRGLLVVVLIVGSLRSAVADWNDVPTGSMKPTILEGDRIVVNKLAYDLKVPFTRLRIARWGAPQRGDIVVFGSPADGTRLVKRVVGLPGDTVALVHNRLLINGTLVSYQPIGASSFPDFRPGPQPRKLAVEQLGEHAHPVMSTNGVSAPRSFAAVTVPEGHYFMLGDNRDESGDSRYFGFVPADSIAGQAVGVALSVDLDRGLRPRWRRFFRALP